jgi:hypothetical protein
LCFETAHSKGVMGVFCGTADSAGLSGLMSEHDWAGLTVGFNTEIAKFTEKGKRRVDGVGDEHTKR